MNKSHNESLKHLLQQHIHDVKLSESQLEELEGMMNVEATAVAPVSLDTNATRPRWGALAAAVMFAAVAVTTFMMSPFSDSNFENMPQQIAEEVVSNHLNMKPLEVKAGSINKVRGYFTKLNFMPVGSKLVALDSLQLLGGRYCSLQGITAAQLRLKQGENLQTLYQTQYKPEVFGVLPHLEQGEQPLIVYAKGVKVKLWVEKGLLFALTDSPAVKESGEEER